MLYARVPTPWNSAEPPKSQTVSGLSWRQMLREARERVFFRFEDRPPDLDFINKPIQQWGNAPVEWYEVPKTGKIKKVFIPFDDREWAGSRTSPRQTGEGPKPQEFRRVIDKPAKSFFYFENRLVDFGQQLLDSQEIDGIWDLETLKLLKKPRKKILFKFEDRRWNIAFPETTQIGKYDIQPNCWYAISDVDYFPPRLRVWLKGRCFMLLRFRGSGSGLGTPLNGYVTEDGQIFYCAEDNSTFYIQES